MSDKYIYQQDGTLSPGNIPAKTLQGYKEGDVLVEGQDFYFIKEYYNEGRKEWITIHQSFFDQFEKNGYEVRTAAIPLKKEENKEPGTFDALPEVTSLIEQLKSLHEENERLKYWLKQFTLEENRPHMRSIANEALNQK